MLFRFEYVVTGCWSFEFARRRVQRPLAAPDFGVALGVGTLLMHRNNVGLIDHLVGCNQGIVEVIRRLGALAALRLIACLRWVGRSIGKSSRIAPCGILST